jgi:hypothetical protein
MSQAIVTFEEVGPKISATSRQLIEEIRTLKIVNPGDEQLAVDAREKVRVCIKRIEEIKDQAVKPLNEQRNRIFSQAKFYLEPLDQALKAVTKVLNDYMDEQARIAEEKARKLHEEQEKRDQIEREKLAEAQRKQRELEKAAKKAKFEEQENLERQAREEAKKAEEAQAALDAKQVQMVEAAPKSIRTESGAMATRKLNWTWEVTDMNELYKKRPDLFVVDEKKLNKLVKEGEREIPGVRIYQESTISGRS